MKAITTGITAILSYLGTVISSIWAIVEFILYLVKDKDFNWWSVWMILICGAFWLLMLFATTIFAVKEEKSQLRKSRFEQRLEQYQKE